MYVIGIPNLEFSKWHAAYLAGIYWSAFTGGRLVSILTAAYCDLKQLLVISHVFVLSGSGKLTNNAFCRINSNRLKLNLYNLGSIAIMVVFNSSHACAWIGTVIMGLGVSSMYGAASGLVFQFVNVRHVHIGAILVSSLDS